MNLVRIRSDAYKIFAISKDSGCQVCDFMDQLRKDDKDEADKFEAFLDFVAEKGPPRNKQKCRLLSDYGGFELKTKRVRLLCFWDKERVIIGTMAFLKDGQKTFRPYLKQLKKDREDYFREKAESNP